MSNENVPAIELTSPLYLTNSVETASPHKRQMIRNSLQTQLRDISYRIDLYEWLVANKCSTSFAQIHRQYFGGIFVDADGILRYENTWQPAVVEEELKIEKNDSSYLFQKTGCFELALILCGSDQSSDQTFKSTSSGSRKATIRLLANWEKLWTIFAENESRSDFVRQHIPLLRVFIAFFFHKRSAQTLIYLSIYNFTLGTICTGSSSANLLIAVGYGFLVISLYITFYRLYRGSVWSTLKFGLFDTHYKFKSSVEESMKSETKEMSTYTKHEIHLTGAMRQLFSATVASLCGANEANDLYHPSSVRTNCSARTDYQRYDTETFDDLMDISLKFLTVYGAFKTNSIQFHRWSYRMALLSAVTILPAIFTFSLYITLIPQWITACSSSYSYEKCLYTTVYAVGSLFFLTDVVIQFLFYGSVVVCLVGLCYGAEIAYWMTDSWIRRFSSLRRVAAKEDEEEKISIFIDNESNEPETLALSEINQLLSRDATEHYLFIVEYMRKAGVIWSPVLAVMYFISLVCMILSATMTLIFFYAYQTEDVAQFLFYLIGQGILYAIFPTISLAHANSFINPLVNTFSAAAEEDFQMIGGRNKWLEFVNAVPAAWTLFGVWITWSKMFAVLSAFFTFFITLAVTQLITTL
eukprot:gene28928-37950_t